MRVSLFETSSKPDTNRVHLFPKPVAQPKLHIVKKETTHYNTEALTPRAQDMTEHAWKHKLCFMVFDHFKRELANNLVETIARAVKSATPLCVVVMLPKGTPRPLMDALQQRLGTDHVVARLAFKSSCTLPDYQQLVTSVKDHNRKQAAPKTKSAKQRAAEAKRKARSQQDRENRNNAKGAFTVSAKQARKNMFQNKR